MPDHLGVPRHRLGLDGCRQRHRCHPQGHHQRNRRCLRHHHLLPHLRQRWRPTPQDNKCGLVSGSEYERSLRAYGAPSMTSKTSTTYHDADCPSIQHRRSRSSHTTFTTAQRHSSLPQFLIHTSCFGIHDQSWIHHKRDTNHTSYDHEGTH